MLIIVVIISYISKNKSIVCPYNVYFVTERPVPGCLAIEPTNHGGIKYYNIKKYLLVFITFNSQFYEYAIEI